MDAVDFDVVVVGAGVAGSVTALLLARSGRSVALIERGESPGSKNLSGGVLYTHTLREVLPDLLAEAPVERRVTRHRLELVNDGSSVGLDYADARLAGNAVTVLRAPFDAWLAGRAEEAGAVLLGGIRVDEALVEGGRVVGVRAGDDVLRARVVVAADGVQSFLARGVGLRPAPNPASLGLGVKAVLALDASVIEERFGVAPGEGAAWTLTGDCTAGLPGGGFLYTNARSVSAGVVVNLAALTRSSLGATDVADRFLAHPAVAPLLSGGRLLEYGAHLVPEGGLAMLGEVATGGLVVVGDAAGLALNTGATLRGMDLAAASAVAAAATITSALARGDVSAAGLAGYRESLLSGVAGADLRTYARAPAFLARPGLYADDGRLAADVLLDVFRHDGTPRRPIARVLRGRLRASSLRDLLAGVRSL